MGEIATLRPLERVEIDARRLGALRRHMGVRNSDAAMSAALEELAYWLYHFEAARRRGETAALAPSARRIAGLARMTGLVSVTRVAQAAEALSEAAAPAALAAVAARLTRIGEISILAVWDIQDMTL